MPHFNDGEVPHEYTAYLGGKIAFLAGLLLLCCLLTIIAISAGPVNIPLSQTARALAGLSVRPQTAGIIWHIRLPQALTAVFAGAGLAIAGAAMQSILRNPLGSPFTLGMSNAAAFGAAFAVMILGTSAMSSSNTDALMLSNQYITAFSAFICCFGAALIIVAVSRIRGSSPEVIILTGVALGSLFTAATMFLQYFADDVQLAAMVFWTFGDLARASWNEIGFLAIVVVVSCIYFMGNRWNYNAIDAGDETARGLGVNVSRVRLVGMLVASLVTAAIVAILGLIGFVGLVCPHMVRRFIGDDHRFLLPASCLAGASLLLASDTAARLIIPRHALPVSVLTAFLGAPVFIMLILRGYRR